MVISGRLRDDKGFILIELVVVVVIVGALSAVAMVSLGGLTHRGTASVCNAHIQAVTFAGNAYVALSPDGRPAASVGALVSAGFLVADPGDVTYTTSTASFAVTGKSGCL